MLSFKTWLGCAAIAGAGLALAMLAQERGRAFDPRIVDCFRAHRDEMIALRERVNRDRPSFADLLG